MVDRLAAEFAYLDQALQKGLMFTAHEVTYSPGNPNTLFDTMIPFIDKLLTKYGKSFATLAVSEQFKLRLICGTISGSVPMICFAEVSKGSCVDHHGLSFGQWGVVVSRDWLECCRRRRIDPPAGILLTQSKSSRTVVYPGVAPI